PLARATFERAKLDWSLLADPTHGAWLDVHRALLAVRRREILPRLGGVARGGGGHAPPRGRGGEGRWRRRGRRALPLGPPAGGGSASGAWRCASLGVHSTRPRHASSGARRSTPCLRGS